MTRIQIIVYTQATMKCITVKDIPVDFFASRQTEHTSQTVHAILEAVHSHGDEAVRTYSLQFDKTALSSFEIVPEDMKKCEKKLQTENPELYKSLCLSRDYALTFAQRQKQSFDDFELELSSGLFAGQKTIAVQTAGVYIPAGRFPLFSSVIMCVMPAKAAGVSQIILCTPPRPHPQKEGTTYADEGILALASLCGVNRAFAIGGAQAIGALAYGTESVPRVDVVVGPGNKYVAEAKKIVYGEVGIDMIAGPSEVLIIADDSAHPDWVASDMLAQAEHDVDAQAILITASKNLADAVRAEIAKQLEMLSTKETARVSLERHGYIIIADTKEEIAALANKKAPEHLELALNEGDERTYFINELRNYGSLFIGHTAAEVLGDYAAGLNHTLPTSGSARFTGGLSVRHFLKTVTTLRGSSETSAQAAYRMAEAEGLAAHAEAARKRLSFK